MAKIVLFIVFVVCILVLTQDALAQTPVLRADCQDSRSVALGHEGQRHCCIDVNSDLGGLSHQGGSRDCLAWRFHRSNAAL